MKAEEKRAEDHGKKLGSLTVANPMRTDGRGKEYNALTSHNYRPRVVTSQRNITNSRTEPGDLSNAQQRQKRAV